MSHILMGEPVVGTVVLGILGIGIVLSVIRLARGPTLADRVVAFDLITVHVMGMITTLAILSDEWVFLDAVIILTLLAFLATLAFARFITRTQKLTRRWPR
jgi:multicomponent Na+:H+ antiporter subunit F